jgi:4-hydroxy-tetrahydrodipicolinate synthase
VKESTRDVTNVTRMINRFGERFKLLCGVDTLAMEEMLLGAQGWVAGLVCAFPAETVAIYKLVKSRKNRRSRSDIPLVYAPARARHSCKTGAVH